MSDQYLSSMSVTQKKFFINLRTIKINQHRELEKYVTWLGSCINEIDTNNLSYHLLEKYFFDVSWDDIYLSNYMPEVLIVRLPKFSELGLIVLNIPAEKIKIIDISFTIWENFEIESLKITFDGELILISSSYVHRRFQKMPT